MSSSEGITLISFSALLSLGGIHVDIESVSDIGGGENEEYDTVVLVSVVVIVVVVVVVVVVVDVDIL